MLREVATACQAYPASIILFLGDFNFLHSDDRRLDLAEAALRQDRSGLGALVDSVFPSLLELEQPNFTRRGLENRAVRLLSRIARVYANLHPIDLADVILTSDVIGSVLEKNSVRDHIPVYF